MSRQKQSRSPVGSRNPNNEKDEEETQTIDIYKKALTFNVIAKYDPLINQLVYLSSYCVVYKYEDSNSGTDWTKLDYQGPLAIYSRNTAPLPSSGRLSANQAINSPASAFFEYGLIVLNRVKPENFTIGLLNNKKLMNPAAKEGSDDSDEGILVEMQGELVIVRDLKGVVFGFWLFDEKDRKYLYEVLKYCIGESSGEGIALVSDKLASNGNGKPTAVYGNGKSAAVNESKNKKKQQQQQQPKSKFVYTDRIERNGVTLMADF